MFDEFQDLDRVSGAVELVRSHIQHHGAVAGYCFAGSAPGMMRTLFGQRSQPLYGQATPVEHGPLPDAAAGEYISARFAEHRRSPGGVLDALLAEARGHPQRLMLLAHNLFAETPRGGAADASAFQRALSVSLEQLGDELSASVGRARRLGAPRAARAGGRRAAVLGSRRDACNGLTDGAADRGLRNLRERGEVWPDDRQLVDPLLERWIRSEQGWRSEKKFEYHSHHGGRLERARPQRARHGRGTAGAPHGSPSSTCSRATAAA